DEVNRRRAGVVAEYVRLGGTRMGEPVGYDVLIDRISHEVPYYRTWLKKASLDGCIVVNNPFMWTADDKFFGAALATRLGIAHPKTVVLPNKEYIPGVIHDESLRNLQYPLDWQGIVEYIGLPCILKDAHGGGWKDVYVCRTLEELIHHYDSSGLLTMIVQEFIEWEHFIRCICIGQDKVMPIKYDPRERKYHVEHDHLGPELGKRVVDDSLKLVRALGYDMNSMEWAVRDGIPYAIDFMNPAPDMDIYSLTPHYFDWVVKAMADMAIDLAKNPRRQVKEMRWDALFTSSREGGGDVGGATSGGRSGSTDDDGDRSAAQQLDAATQSGGPTAAQNQKIQELTASSGESGGYSGSVREALAGSGGETPLAGAAASASSSSTGDGGLSGGYSGSAQEALGGGGSSGATTQGGGGGGHTGDAPAATEPIRAEGAGGYVDQSPATDLEPPADARAEQRGGEVGNGRTQGDSGEKGHGRAAGDQP
ncbi:MAG TPA: hypothetical protein VFS20_27755, partial [Longimicrobium sp.]|nr:hypothetical protein [Longimicrobium sp.]